MIKYFKFIYIISYIRIFFYKIVFRRRLFLNGWRYFWGKGTVINIKSGRINMLDKVYLKRGCEINCDGGKIEIGYNNFFNNNCNIASMNSIKIGDNCLFGPNVGIFDHNHKYDSIIEPICKQGFKSKSIEIGNNVWIGSNVVITAGSKIGDRVVVGANSVVVGSLEKDSIYCGNPVKLIKKI